MFDEPQGYDALEIAKRHRAHAIRVFGSVAPGEAGERSDIDFPVDFEQGSSLFDLLHLTEELRDLLGHPVDVLSVGGLKERDDRILAEAVDLWAEPTRTGSPTSSKRPTRSQASSPLARPPGTATASRSSPLERLVEINGESARAMSAEARAKYRDVAWSDVIGLRILLAHHYHRVDPDQVWAIAATEVPTLAERLA